MRYRDASIEKDFTCHLTKIYKDIQVVILGINCVMIVINGIQTLSVPWRNHDNWTVFYGSVIFLFIMVIFSCMVWCAKSDSCRRKIVYLCAFVYYMFTIAF